MRADIEAHDPLLCPGCYGDVAGGAHPLIGTLHEGLPIVAVRTPDCPLNGTDHTWVKDGPHIFDWTYLREESD